MGYPRELLIRRVAGKHSIILKKIIANLKHMFPQRNDRKILGQALQIYVRRLNGGSREYRKPRLVDGKEVIDRRCELDPLKINGIRGSTILDNLEIWDDENDRIRDLRILREELNPAKTAHLAVAGAVEGATG